MNDATPSPDDDLRLDEYLRASAAGIDLPHRDSSTIAARARQRRHARRSMVVFGTAAVILLVAGALIAGSSRRQSVNTAGLPAPVRGDLTWSSVEVTAGLAWSADTVTASDGSLYSLSTAPGPLDSNAVPSATVLYRSTDGRTWSTAALPDGLKASALATSGGHLYAVGTAPAGGGSDLVVASSTDGASTWTEAQLPSPRPDLVARFGSQIRVSNPRVASGPGGLVAAVTVSAQPDVNALLAAHGSPPENMYRTTATGVDVFAPADPTSTQCQILMAPSTTTTADPSTATTDASASTDSTGTTPPTDAAIATAKGDQALSEVCKPQVAYSYTWAELGLDPDLQAVLGGELHVYASADGSSFDEVGHPDDPIGGVASLTGGADGYRLLAADTQSSTVHPYWSTDGRTWTAAGPELDGWVQAAGSLGDTAAAVTQSQTGMNLLLAGPGGSWTSTDLRAAIGLPPAASKLGIVSAAFGPLGLVVVIYDGPTGDLMTVADSADGRTFAKHTLAELGAPGLWSVAGTAVSADAVVVRLLPQPSGTPSSTPGPQRLLIGTPTP